MKTLLLFGVSPKKGTGYQVLQLALQQSSEWCCAALVRDAAFAAELNRQGVQTVVGDATDESSVKEICRLAGTNTIIVSTLGGSAGAHYLAQRLIIDTAEQAGISRMLLVTSLGCGDSWHTMSERAKTAFGHAVREKSLAEVWLQTSKLNYEILRPGGLSNVTLLAQVNVFISRRYMVLFIVLNWLMSLCKESVPVFWTTASMQSLTRG